VLTGILAKVPEEVMPGWKKDTEQIEERNLYWNRSPLSGADEVGVDPWLLLSPYFILKVK
jgi:hypothetical protein